MPTYEYRCRDCGREFELFQRMSDEPRAPCPDCGQGAERLISGGAGLLFKGDGFYITDYRSEAYRKRAKEESGAGNETGTDKEPAGAKPTGSGPAEKPGSAGNNGKSRVDAGKTEKATKASGGD